ncbi:MAG: MFS family permease [Paracrocinitomix sp.]|jgi:MFS family permease
MSMNRNTLSVALGLFIVGYGTNVSTPFLVLYRDRLGLNTNATQLIFVVYVVGILSTLMVAGQLSDRYGRKRLLVASLALSAVGSLLIVFGRDAFGLLIAGRIVLGIVSGLGLGVGAAWLQDLLGPGQQAKAALIATLVTYGGFGAAPPLSVL